MRTGHINKERKSYVSIFITGTARDGVHMGIYHYRNTHKQQYIKPDLLIDGRQD